MKCSTFLAMLFFVYGLSNEVNHGPSLSDNSSDSLLSADRSNINCPPIQTLPYVQDFEGPFQQSSFTNSAPDCWYSITDGLGRSQVVQASIFVDNDSNAFELTNYLQSPSEDYMLISPSILQLTSSGTRMSYSLKGHVGTTIQIGVMNDPYNPQTFSVLKTEMIVDAEYREYQLDILPTQNSHIAFRHGQSGNFRSLYVDDINFNPLPQCREATNARVSSVSYDEVTFVWDQSTTGQTPHYYRVTNEGDSPTINSPVASGVQVSNAPLSITVNGLSPDTSYDIHIQTICALNNLSAWSEPFTFETKSAPLNIPIFEGFENSQAGDTFNQNVPDGWSIINQGHGYSYVADSPSASNTGNKSYAFFHFHGLENAITLISPEIEDIASNGVQLEFYFRGSNFSSVEVGLMTDPDDMSTFSALDTTTLASGFYSRKSIYIYPENAGYIAFKPKGTSNRLNFIYLDDISISALPDCNAPNNINSSNIDNTTATMSWRSVADDFNGYEWIVLPQGTAPNLNQALFGGNTASGSSSVNLTGLDQSTTYNFYVRADCDRLGMSDWSDVHTFRTDCNLDYVEQLDTFDDFSSGCWNQATGTFDAPSTFGSTDWQSLNFGNTGTDIAAGCKVLYGTASSAKWLITPNIDLGNGGNYQLDFNLSATQYDQTSQLFLNNNDDKIGVSISSDDGATWNNLVTYTGGSSPSPSGSNIVLDLSMYQGNVKIGFSVISERPAAFAGLTSFDVFIDDFTITEGLGCNAPPNVQVATVTHNFARITWDNGVGVTDGYEYVFTSNGTPPVTNFNFAASGTTANGVNEKYFRNLSSGVEYEFYVRSKCGNSNSLWSPVTVLQTVCLPSVLPISQGFETFLTVTRPDSYAPLCWEVIDNGIGGVYPRPFDNTSNSGFNHYELKNWDDGINDPNGDYMLITPNIPEISSNGVQVNYYLKGIPNDIFEIGTLSDPTDPSTFTVLKTERITSYNYEAFSLNILSSSDNYVAFRHGQNRAFSSFFIDDIVLGPLPACLSPQNLSLSNLRDTDAIISWTAESTATNGYEWVVMPENASPDTSTAISTGIVDSSTYTTQISNLLGESNFTVYVRSNCNTDGLSEWTSGLAFSTPCGLQNSDYIETFDSQINPCWDEAIGTATEPTNYGSSFWSSKRFGNSGSNNSAFLAASESISSHWLISDPVNIGSNVSHQLLFDIALTIANSPRPTSLGANDEVGVKISTDRGDSWNDLINYDENSSLTHTGETVVVDLSGFSNTIKIAFYSRSGTGLELFDLFIDNFKIQETPACPSTINVQVDQISTSSMDISWNDVNEERGGYDWIVTTLGVSPSISNALFSGLVTTGNTITSVTGLNSSTDYIVYIRTRCNGRNSEWSNELRVTTPCTPLFVPSSENFNSTVLGGALNQNAPQCWSFIADPLGSCYVNTPNPLQQNNYYLLNNNNDYDGDYMLISPYLPELLTDGIQVEFEVGDLPGQQLKIGTISDPLDPNTFVELESITTSVLGFESFNINILQGNNPYMAFKHAGTSELSTLVAIDNVFFKPLPACLPPTNLVASNITSDSAILTWTLSPTASTTYEWVIMPQDMMPALNNALFFGAVGMGINTVTVNGLSGNTHYDFYLRSSCGATESSVWTAVQSLETSCGNFPTDYFEDFSNELGSCWQTATGTDVVPVNYEPSGWGVYNFRNLSADNDAARLITMNDQQAKWLISPLIDLANGRIKELAFDIAVTASSNSDAATLEPGDQIGIMILPDNGISWDRIFTYESNNGPSHLGLNQTIDLSMYSGNVKIGFYVKIDGTDNIDKAVFIDNFSVRENLTCAIPTGLAVINIGATSADFSWDAVSSETTGYEYVVMPQDALPDNSSAVASGTTSTGITTVSLSSLEFSSTYGLYVKTKCDILGSSEWSIVERFTTECPVFSVPFTENFDTTVVSYIRGNSSPRCWNYINEISDQGIYNYVVSSSFSNSGTNFYALSNSAGSENSMLISPRISNLSTNGALVSLYVAGSAGQKIDIGTMSDPQNAASFNLVQTMILNSNSYELFEVNIPAASDEHIAFKSHEDNNALGSLLIDDISFDISPDCPRPTGVLLEAVGATTATVSWSGVQNSSNGYEWVVMSAGTMPDIATASSAGTTSFGVGSLSLTGLVTSTNYDFYLRSDCGTAGISEWSNTLSFTSTPLNDNACNAIAIVLNNVSQGTNYTNVGATSQDNEPSDNFQSGTEKSVWFKFQAPPTGDVRISTDYFGSTLNDTELAAYDVVDCADFSSYSQLGFDQNGGVDVRFNSILNLYDLIPNQEYYIQVDGYGNDMEGTFGLTVSEIGYIYENSSWYPYDPSGVSMPYAKIEIINGTGVLTSRTTALEVIVQPEAVLEIMGDLTAEVLFNSSANGAAQLADTNGNQIIGATTVERYIPAKRNYRFLSSPLDSYGGIYENWQEEGLNPVGYGTHITGSSTGESGFDINPSGAPSLFTFNNLQNVWEAVGNTYLKRLNQGEAYRIFVRGDRNIDLAANNPTPTTTILRATGTLSSGTFSPQLATGADEFSFIGNPYQATVDFSSVMKTNLSNYFYVWDSSVNDRGVYVSVDLSDLTAPLPGSSDASQYIAPGQAVFVRNTSAGNGLIEFNESDKAINASQVTVFNTFDDFYINTRLYRTNDLDSGISESDALGLRFRESYTTQGTDEDAIKLSNLMENFAVVNNGLRSIDKQNIPQNGHEVQLYTDGYNADDYSITMDVGNIPLDINLYLVDGYLETQIEVLDGFTYHFDTVDEGSRDPLRFRLLFSNTTLGTVDLDMVKIKVYPNPANELVYIEIPSYDNLILANLYNMLGQLVLSTTEEHINISTLKTGVYVLEIKTEKGVTSQSIIKKSDE
ncbi:MAG: choice-of-anchor J domain-containing protein [Nonlabens sp.]